MFWNSYQLISHVISSDMKFFLYSKELLLLNTNFLSSVIAHFEALNTLILNLYDK